MKSLDGNERPGPGMNLIRGVGCGDAISSADAIPMSNCSWFLSCSPSLKTRSEMPSSAVTEYSDSEAWLRLEDSSNLGPVDPLDVLLVSELAELTE